MAQLKRYNGASWDIVGGIVTGDTLPIGSEIDYDGATAPAGWQEIADYSTSEEVKTGENWVDGKPIYRIVYYISSLPNATSVDYNHNIANVDKIWCDVGHTYIDWQSSVGTSPLPYIGGTSFNSMIEIRGFNSSKFTIDTHATDRRSLCAYVTINYTKTTD